MKIEVGDWVQIVIDYEDADGVVDHGWHRVDELNSIQVICESRKWHRAHITAHRPKSGPFKVGDVIRYKGDTDDRKDKTVTEITDHKCPALYYSTNGFYWAGNVTLIKPVEAIEAEMASLETLAKDYPDETLIALLESRGYRIERIEKPVTLEDLPKIGNLDSNGSEWVYLGNDIWHGENVNYCEFTPAEVLEYLDEMARQRIAAGALDSEVKQRMEG